MRLGLFRRDRPPPPKDDAARVKQAVLRLLVLPPETVVAVNEIICADPACPGTETVILVMRPGHRTKAYKLAMAMVEVTEEALARTLSEPAAG